MEEAMISVSDLGNGMEVLAKGKNILVGMQAHGVPLLEFYDTTFVFDREIYNKCVKEYPTKKMLYHNGEGPQVSETIDITFFADIILEYIYLWTDEYKKFPREFHIQNKAFITNNTDLQYILEQVCDLLDVDYDHYEGCEWSEVYNDNLDGKTISFDVIEKELLPRLYKKGTAERQLNAKGYCMEECEPDASGRNCKHCYAYL